MKTIATTALPAQECKLPEPTKEHQWLAQLAGEWDIETEIHMEPGKPPMKVKRTESTKMFGGFWAVGEVSGDMMGAPWQARSSFGYSPEKKKYICTWLDSMTSMLWTHEGVVEGNVLTLEAAGPCPMTGKHYQVKTTIEIKSPTVRTFTRHKQEDDGAWTLVIDATCTRKK